MLKVRTGYSFHTAVGKLTDVFARLKEIEAPAFAISDRASTYGFVKWDKMCRKAGVRPVFGVELGVTPRLGEKHPVIDYWTFIARDSLVPLHSLVMLATGAQAGKEPVLTVHQALSAEGVFKIAGDRLLVDELPDVLPDDFFLALSPATNKLLVKRAMERELPFIAASDNFYPREEDREFYRVALGGRAFIQTYPQHILSKDEWGKAVARLVPAADAEDAWEAALNVMESSRAELVKAQLLRPEKPKTLREMCIAGAEKVGCDLTDETYSARLEKELKLIADKKFEDYFYIIADMVEWAKSRMIVGPARGSSCGSLVCYLLGITSIDPIPFGLIFERFIDINRMDLPDIDIDFSDERRDMVFEYVEQKYGRHRVARLGTVGSFQPRSAMKAVGAALRVPQWRLDRVLDGLIERSSGDSRAQQQLEDTLKETVAGKELLTEVPDFSIAAKLEGHPSNAGQHAAGIIITEKPITEYVAVDERTGSAMCDKKDAEELNLLKIDALGLTQLSIFERTLELIGEEPVSGWLEKIPLDDPLAFDVLNRGHFSGVFQFMGAALRYLTRQVHVSKIDDIINITALARPGAMATGGATTWARRHSGTEAVSYPHELFRAELEETLGIVAYQEQVMNIGRNIGDLSWEDVTALRKAMSKSLGAEYFNQFGDRWKAAAEKKGIPKDDLIRIWDDLCAYGAWSFNKAHSVAYGLVSYWCLWLKAHHPLEFAAATLDAERLPERQIAILRELESEGITYVPFDFERSTNRWEIAATEDGTKYLVGPMTNIKGIGPAIMNDILIAREKGMKLRDGIMKKIEGATTPIDSLYPISDRINALMPDPAARNITTPPMKVIEVQCREAEYSAMVIAVVDKIAPKSENDPISLAKRGGRRLIGPDQSLNLFVKDDTDQLFCKIGRFKYEELARDVIERGRPGKSIYAIKGTVPRDFRMISVKQIRYIGDMEND